MPCSASNRRDAAASSRRSAQGLRGNFQENMVGFASFGEICGPLVLVVQPPLATTVRVNHGRGAFTVKVVVHVPCLEKTVHEYSGRAPSR